MVKSSYFKLRSFAITLVGCSVLMMSLYFVWDRFVLLEVKMSQLNSSDEEDVVSAANWLAASRSANGLMAVLERARSVALVDLDGGNDKMLSLLPKLEAAMNGFGKMALPVVIDRIDDENKIFGFFCARLAASLSFACGFYRNDQFREIKALSDIEKILAILCRSASEEAIRQSACRVLDRNQDKWNQ